MLIPMLIVGILLGGGANVAALAGGAPIWIGLLLHSGFGTLGMILTAVALLGLQALRNRGRSQRPAPRQDPSTIC